MVDQLYELVERVTTLSVQGASDSYGENDKYSISYEVNQLLEQVFNASNTVFSTNGSVRIERKTLGSGY